MKTVKIGNLLYCHVRDKDEFNKIIERETPEYDYDLIERHRKDVGVFSGTGFYKIEYLVCNPCDHGFWIKKLKLSEISNLIKNMQELLNQHETMSSDNVSNQFI